MAQTREYNYFLPKEMLIKIFNHLDRRTLVFSCRLVCRFWKEAVETPDVWKVQLSREADKLQTPEVKSILPTAHLNYPWYMCYVLCKNIFCLNMLPDCCCEENLVYWRDVLNRTNGLICSAPLDIHHQGYSAAPSDLDPDVSTCFVTSFGDCALNQAIDLYSCGFTRKVFEYRPAIHISEWFAVGFNFSGVCHIEVTFFDSQWKSDHQNGHFRYARRLIPREWYKVSHTFTNYRPDVRYVTLKHGVNTYLPSNQGGCRQVVTHGKKAAKIVGGKLTISLPKIPESFDSE